jgi:phage tail sheath protein FI
MCAASGIALCAFTYSDSVGGVWASPAGPNRGNVSGTIGINQVGYVSGVLGTSNVQFNRVRLNDGLRDSLFSLCNINPIIDSTQFGISVWAQKTRVNLAFFSSLDRINVARTVMFIRRGVRKMMMRYLEENNTETVRKSITSTVSSYLHDIKIKDGLYDFAVLCDTSNNTPDTIDRNELYVQIALKPVKAIEFIYVPITLVKTGDSLTG